MVSTLPIQPKCLRDKVDKKTNCNNSLKSDHGVEQNHRTLNHHKPMKMNMRTSGSPLIWSKPGKYSCCFEMRNEVYKIFT